MSCSAFAQWSAPSMPATVDMDDSGETVQFLYNAHEVGFFAGSNPEKWNTRASVAAFGDSIKMEKIVDTETWFMHCYPSVRIKEWRYVAVNSFDGIWVDANTSVDNGSYTGVDKWVITKVGNAYKIKNNIQTAKDGESNPDGTLGAAEIYQGQRNVTDLFINFPDYKYTKVTDGEETQENVFEGEFYDEWYFITPETYAELQPKVAAYRAALSLKAALDAAKSGEYADKCDFSPVEAVYNNTASTAEELQAAEENIQTIITLYKASLATFDEPLEMPIGDGSDVAPWTREFTGTGEVGTWHTNTWSTEANGGADGTDMTTPFCEDWVANGSILSDQKIFQVLEGAAPGLYKFTANIRLYNEAGSETLTGATMYFGDNKLVLSDDTQMYKSGSKSVLWNANYFTIVAIVKEAGDIEFGIDIKDATFNWVAFKNTSLTYYGNENVEANAEKLFKMSYTFDDIDENVAANADIIKAYKDAVAAFNEASTADAVKAAANAATEAKKALNENIAAYEVFATKSNEWNENIAKNSSLEGDYWANWTDFIGVESFDELEGLPEAYPKHTPTEVLAAYPYNTEEINKYIKVVDSLYSEAVANSLAPGTDCTGMLINPNFGSGTTIHNKNGWSGKTDNVLLGGIHENMCAEVFEKEVDFYQVVKGAPAGIYSIKTRAFVRPSANGSYYGSESINCWLYMNDFRTPIQHIVDDVLSQSEAEDQVNCLITNPTMEYWPSTAKNGGNDYLYSGVNTKGEEVNGYVPNCMIGAALAFKAGRYNVKTYGLVGDGEDMKIGITSNGEAVKQWFLFSGFELTYEGKTSEAIFNILPTYQAQLADLLTANESNLTTPMKTEMETLAKRNLSVNDDADLLWETLQAVNKAINDANNNIETVKTLISKKSDMNQALTTYESTITPAAYEMYQEVAIEAEEYEELTTEQLLALIDKIEETIQYIKVINVAEASDDYPVPCTKSITNADFAEGDKDTQTGWTYTKNDGNGPEIATGFNGTRAMEFWNGTAANLQFDIYQTISHLMPGKYEVTVEAANSMNGVEATENDPDGRAVLYVKVGDKMHSVAINVQEEPCSDLYNQYSVIFTVPENTDVTIGLKTVGTMAARWFVADNFTLTCYGTNSAKQDTDEGLVNIADVDSNDNTPAAIYNISGAKVNALQKGINIVKMTDGTVRKVFVK